MYWRYPRRYDREFLHASSIQPGTHTCFHNVIRPSLALGRGNPFSSSFSNSIVGNSPSPSVSCLCNLYFILFACFAFFFSQLPKSDVHRLNNFLVCRVMDQSGSIFIKIIVHFTNSSWLHQLVGHPRLLQRTHFQSCLLDRHHWC